MNRGDMWAQLCIGSSMDNNLDRRENTWQVIPLNTTWPGKESRLKSLQHLRDHCTLHLCQMGPTQPTNA